MTRRKVPQTPAESAAYAGTGPGETMSREGKGRRVYAVTCAARKCKHKFSWDADAPIPCPECGSARGVYKGSLVCLSDTRMSPPAPAKLTEARCSEGDHPNDDNPEQAMCKTCADWTAKQAEGPSRCGIKFGVLGSIGKVCGRASEHDGPHGAPMPTERAEGETWRVSRSVTGTVDSRTTTYILAGPEDHPEIVAMLLDHRLGSADRWTVIPEKARAHAALIASAPAMRAQIERLKAALSGLLNMDCKQMHGTGVKMYIDHCDAMTLARALLDGGK